MLLNTTVFPLIHYDDGIKKVPYVQSEQKEIIEGILYQTKKNPIKEKLYMLEFLHPNRNLIYKTKLNICKKSILNMNSLRTLDQESTLAEKDSGKFWTSYLKKKSKRLWLPLMTDSPDSVLNCSNIFSTNSVPNSKVLIPIPINHQMKNLQKTSYRSLQFLQQDTTEEGDINLTRKIRIYPNENQKRFFNKCFGTTRYIYNKVVELVNKKYKEAIEKATEQSNLGCVFKNKKEEQCCKEIMEDTKYFCKVHKKSKLKYDFKLSLPYLRKEVLTNNKDITEDFIWLKEVPYDTRQLVIKDFIGAYKSALTNIRNGNIKCFNLNYKSKKDNTSIFHINKKAIDTKLNIFKRLKIGRLRTTKKMKKWISKNIKDIECDCKIIKQQAGRYYLLLTQKKHLNGLQEKYRINPLCHSVSLDPGERTFQTFYSPDGIAGKLGDNFANKKIKPLNKKIDKLTGIKTKVTGKTRYNIKKRIALLRTKIKDIVSNLHWKVADFLCVNFGTIIIPNFETQKMAKKPNRKINKARTRSMLSLSHYKFRIKLLHKSRMYKRNVIVVNENYTSKTCSSCGYINEKLGSKKKFNCPSCKKIIDRDYNGARNIMLRTCFSK